MSVRLQKGDNFVKEILANRIIFMRVTRSINVMTECKVIVSGHLFYFIVVFLMVFKKCLKIFFALIITSNS